MDRTHDEIITMLDAYESLKRSAIYAQRVDWMLSGDDGGDTFIKRTNEELAELEPKLAEFREKIISDHMKLVENNEEK